MGARGLGALLGGGRGCLEGSCWGWTDAEMFWKVQTWDLLLNWALERGKEEPGIFTPGVAAQGPGRTEGLWTHTGGAVSLDRLTVPWRPDRGVDGEERSGVAPSVAVV